MFKREDASSLTDPRDLAIRHRVSLKPVLYGAGITGVFALANHVSLTVAMWLTFGFGVPVGLMAVAMREIGMRVRLRNFLLNILIHSLLYAVVLTIAIVLEFGMLDYLHAGHERGYANNLQWLSAHGVVVATLYGSFMAWVFVMTAMRAFSRKLGRGVIIHWLTGYYHNPRRENRVVMFLDLQNSTGLAEELGDEAFSSLVRDFFSDLSEPLERCKGEISHYIGDEAVITWPDLGGPIPALMLQCFYLFDRSIAEKSERYKARYHVVPRFKAGVHAGPVVVSEVGDVKSEFVLHGDVLNVASRIQGLCNDFGERVLLSETLASRLIAAPWFETHEVGRVSVKGKSDAMTVFAAALTPTSVAAMAKRNPV